MLFVTSMNIIPGNYTKAIKLFKNPVFPPDVGEVAELKTAVGFPIDKMRWMQ